MLKRHTKTVMLICVLVIVILTLIKLSVFPVGRYITLTGKSGDMDVIPDIVYVAAAVICFFVVGMLIRSDTKNP